MLLLFPLKFEFQAVCDDPFTFLPRVGSQLHSDI